MALNDSGWTRRRRFLELAGTAGAVGLAGCAQGGDGGGDGNDSDGSDGSDGSNDSDGADGSDGSDGGGGALLDDEFTNGAWMVPSKHQWNPYSLTNYSGEIATMSYDPLAAYNTRSEEWVPNLATDWSVTQGEEATVTLREQTWWNGDPVLAKDLEIQFRIEKHLNDPLWDLIEGVSATGDRTLSLSLPGSVNEDVLLHRLLGTRLQVRRDLFEEKLEAIENASSEEERDSAIEDALRTSMDEPYGHGPYEFDQAGSSHAVSEKFEDHPNADEITVPKYGWWKAASNQQRWAALKGGKTDGYGSTYTPPKVVDSYPDHVVAIKIPTYADYAVAFNHTRPPWDDVRVRQAIAHVVDRKAVADSVGPRTRQPVEVITGTSPYVYDNYFDDSFLGQLSPYETNTETAAQLLRDAGLSKENGKWVHDGSPLSPELVVHSGFSDFVSGCQQVVGLPRSVRDRRHDRADRGGLLRAGLPRGRLGPVRPRLGGVEQPLPLLRLPAGALLRRGPRVSRLPLRGRGAADRRTGGGDPDGQRRRPGHRTRALQRRGGQRPHPAVRLDLQPDAPEAPV